MNFSHLKTIAWLRWRLVTNQFRRVGKAHRIFTLILIAGAMLGSIGICFLAWFASGTLLEDAPSGATLLIWGLIAGVFLFAWSIGVLTDLQKSEPLALSKFLHLPVSPKGAFLNNFLSSFISFSMILIFPVMLGFAFGMVRYYGPRLLPGLLLLFAFLFLVVAITYQFRGWLAALMVNKRRRRAIITGLTFGVILISQLPQLMNTRSFEKIEKADDQIDLIAAKAEAVLTGQLDRGEISDQEHKAGFAAIKRDKNWQRKEALETILKIVRPVATFVPFAWLPLGMESLVLGGGFINLIAVPLACFVLMVGLGVLSLQRSYATTLRMYRGENVTVKRQTDSNDTEPGSGEYQPTWINRLLEKKIPFLNEQQSAIATGTMAAVIRAPEAKMALLTPFLIMVILGISFSYRNPEALPIDLRAFTGIGVVTFAMFGIMQLVNNQFGYDRDGFRCMVLSPVRRTDVLIGKNMGFAPFAIGVAAIGIAIMQFFLPMRPTHFLATLVQLFSVFLITCSIANLMSIKAPLAIASGTMKPMNMNLSIVVLQLLITLLVPICLLPTMIPPAVEIVMAKFFGIDNIPIYLILSFIWLAVTLVIYRFVISVQGRMLEESEKKILETVTQVGT